jgi:hypothetical protein
VSVRHGGGLRPNAVAKFEDEGEDVLGDRFRSVSRHIAHRDAAGAGRGGVHDIVAGGQHADEPEVRQSRDGFGGQRCLVGQHDMRRGGIRCHLGRRGGVVHFEAAEPGHVAPVEATIEQMSRVEDNDAGRLLCRDHGGLRVALIPPHAAGDGADALVGGLQMAAQGAFGQIRPAFLHRPVDAQVLAQAEPASLDPEVGADQLEFDDEVNDAGALRQQRIAGGLQ